MNTMTTTLYWQMLSAGVIAIVWLIRLEGRVNLNAREHDRHEREVERQFDALIQSRGEMRDDIKYIRGRIDAIASHVTDCPMILNRDPGTSKSRKED